ncbi:hypothetical protein [Pseudomonas aeruginosa]|uniref:hypothetical protein n=1 Tax=Pseudomonas aeruginosa TaxID=287 RepID=UPI00190F78DD|nr:hypothetical protein [Pseudomonas aeruginosa]
MKGTVHPRRLLLCLVLVPALLAGLGAWQSWRAEQQAERLGAAQQRVERALAEARALPPRASVRVDGRAMCATWPWRGSTSNSPTHEAHSA